MLKKVITIFFSISLIFLLNNSNTASANTEDDDVVDEFAGKPIIVYGGSLDNTQKEETKRLLGSENEAIDELDVTGVDLANYIGGNPNANMYSSVKITFKEKGHGIKTDIVTEDNITKVTSDMYTNALLTAGVTDALVEIASPIKVTGESALTGIYKAYDIEGQDLDPERMKVATEELEVSTKLADEGLSNEEVASLIAEIKKELAENESLSREEIEKLVDDKTIQLNIELDMNDKQMLVDLFDKIKELDIDFDEIKNQLIDVSGTLKDKLEDQLEDVDTDSLLEKIKNFFKELFNFFTKL